MASLPPRRESQRRVSPEQRDSNQQQAPQSPVRTRSATSEDSQTLFINSAPAEDTDQRHDQQHQHTSPPQPGSREDPEIKTCWICFSDSTEDTTETSPWRDPCPCALVAHEECLLDWIADLEAPSNRRSRSIRQQKIECPQCKSEIKLARQRNYIVEAVRGLERIGARTILPGGLTLLSASLYQSSMAWGMHSIYAIFGSEDGYRILRPLIQNSMRTPIEVYLDTPREASQKLLGLIMDHLVHWRLYVGLPLITPMLILSRTKLADSILPVLPVLFFATSPHSVHEPLDFTHWPPSASLCFAVLPYVRAAYNTYYEKVWAEKTRRWYREIQPRSGQGQIDANGAAQEPIVEDGLRADDEDENGVFEVRIDGGIWDEWEEPPAEAQAPPPPRRRADQALPLVQPPLHDQNQQARPPPNIADNRAQQQVDPQVDQMINPPAQQRPANNDQLNPQPQPNAQQQQPLAPVERRLSFSPTAIAETVLGAILFPTLAGLSGDLLKALLPRSWTTATIAPGRFYGYGGGGRGARGLLQDRWARSLVGGCLFVVAKDAVMLYVRWRMAEMQRGRRVLDYPGPRGRARARARAR